MHSSCQILSLIQNKDPNYIRVAINIIVYLCFYGLLINM